MTGNLLLIPRIPPQISRPVHQVDAFPGNADANDELPIPTAPPVMTRRGARQLGGMAPFYGSPGPGGRWPMTATSSRTGMVVDARGSDPAFRSAFG